MISTMDSIKQIINDYNMGFLSAHEVCNQFLDVLTYFGADKELAEQMDKELTPLARFLMDNFEKHSGRRIEQFQEFKGEYL